MTGCPSSKPYASRAGAKLESALSAFGIAVEGVVCADLGCSSGGFTDCLLRRGAAKVYAVDTAAGVLEYSLRIDPRVVCLERANAMHLRLPEPCGLVTIDLGWTRQRKIVRNAAGLLGEGASIVSLVKPHYEADPALLRGGVLPDEFIEGVLAGVDADVRACGVAVAERIESPIRGRGGNREFLWRLQPAGG